jgi:hypothetical protein
MINVSLYNRKIEARPPEFVVREITKEKACCTSSRNNVRIIQRTRRHDVPVPRQVTEHSVMRKIKAKNP